MKLSLRSRPCGGLVSSGQKENTRSSGRQVKHQHIYCDTALLAVTEDLLANMPQCLAQHLCDEGMAQSRGSYWAETGQPSQAFHQPLRKPLRAEGPFQVPAGNRPQRSTKLPLGNGQTWLLQLQDGWQHVCLISDALPTPQAE